MQIIVRIVNNADSMNIFIHFLITLLCHFIEKHVICNWIKFYDIMEQLLDHKYLHNILLWYFRFMINIQGQPKNWNPHIFKLLLQK